MTVPEAQYTQCSSVLYLSGEWDAIVKNGAIPLRTGPMVTVDSRTAKAKKKKKPPASSTWN